MKRLCTATLAASLLLGSLASTASATTITPSTTADDITTNGNCTLREAVQAANTDTAVDQCSAGSGADVIQLGTGTYTLDGASKDDANHSGDLDVTAPLTIQGNGAASTTIDAQTNDRAIDVFTNAATTLQSLTLTNGAAPAEGSLFTGGAGEAGGAVRALSALTLTDVSITISHAGNATTDPIIAGADGNAGGDGGGVWTDHPLTITRGGFRFDSAGNGSPGTDGAPAASGSGNPGNAGGNGGAGGSGGAIAIALGAKVSLSMTGTGFQAVSAGSGGTGGDGTKGTDNPGGAGGKGGDAGNGGAGGFGGVISTNGPVTSRFVVISPADAGNGGDSGTGGSGGSGSTQDGQQGRNGNGGGGGAGGAFSGDEGALTVSHTSITKATAGAGGAAPHDVGASPQGGAVPGEGGAGGAIDGGEINVDHSGISNAHAGRGGTGATFSGAKPPPGGSGGLGGGIHGTAVTVSDSFIATAAGGQGGPGGTNTTLSGVGDGGSGGQGGGVYASDTLTLTNLTLDHDAGGVGGNAGFRTGGNSGSQGGRGGNGGGVFAVSGGTLTNVTFDVDAGGDGGTGSDNGAGGFGGSGGAIRAAGPLGIVRVTIAESNPGAAGPARSAGAPAGQPGTAGAIFGGGILGNPNVSDSVIAGNGGGQCVATIDGGGNVSFPDNSCGAINADPKLEALTANGGTKTMLLGPGSAALDTHSCTGADQRGVPRPQGPACDSGAVEVANPALTADGGDFGPVPQGQTATRTITIHDTFDPLTPQVSLSSPDFSIVSDGCSGVALFPPATCAVQVEFTAPAAPGVRNASLHLAHDAAGPALDVPLTATVADITPPLLSGLALAHKTFRVAKRKPAPKGTAIKFTLSEPASVKFTVTQKRPGRRKGKRCVAPTKKLRHAKHCTRTVALGSFTRSAGAGASSVPFNGRVNGRKLKPGSYTLTLSPTDPSGNHGAPHGIGFKIVKR